MNAAILALLASSGVVGFGWQPMPDGTPSYEYVVQLEPELLAMLAEGQSIPISSDVPEDIRPIRRIRVVVGRGPLPQQKLVTQFKPWPDAAKSHQQGIVETQYTVPPVEPSKPGNLGLPQPWLPRVATGPPWRVTSDTAARYTSTNSELQFFDNIFAQAFRQSSQPTRALTQNTEQSVLADVQPLFGEGTLGKRQMQRLDEPIDAGQIGHWKQPERRELEPQNTWPVASPPQRVNSDASPRYPPLVQEPPPLVPSHSTNDWPFDASSGSSSFAAQPSRYAVAPSDWPSVASSTAVIRRSMLDQPADTNTLAAQEPTVEQPKAPPQATDFGWDTAPQETGNQPAIDNPQAIANQTVSAKAQPSENSQNQSVFPLILAWVLLSGSGAGNLYLFWSYLDIRDKYRSVIRSAARKVGSRLAID